MHTRNPTSPSTTLLFVLFLGYFSLVFGAMLFNNYLLNDDWAAILWERGDPLVQLIRSHPYFPAAIPTGRSVGHILTALTHYPLTSIENGVYIRFFSLLWLSSCATLLMRWMVKRCEYTPLFSSFFIASAFILPCFYQSVAHISGQYLLHALFLMLLNIMMTERLLNGEDLFGNSRLFRGAYLIFLGTVLYLTFQLYPLYFRNLMIALVTIFLLTYAYIRWHLKRPALSPATNLSLLTFSFLIPLNTYVSFALFYFTAGIIYALSPKHLFKPESIKKCWQMFLFGCSGVCLYFLLTKATEMGVEMPERYTFKANFDLINKLHMYITLLTKSFAFWLPEHSLAARAFILPTFLFIAAVFSFRLNEETDRRTQLLGASLAVFIVFSLGVSISPAILAPTMVFTVYRILMPQSVAIYFLLFWSVSMLWSKYLHANPYSTLQKIKLPPVAFSILCVLSLMSMDIISKYIIMPKKYEINYIKSMLLDHQVLQRTARGEQLNILIRTSDRPSMIGDMTISGEDMTLSITGAHLIWINPLVIALFREIGINSEILTIQALQDAPNATPRKGMMKFHWGQVKYVRDDPALHEELKAGPAILIDMRYIGRLYR